MAKVVTVSVSSTPRKIVTAGLFGTEVTFVDVANSALWIGGSDIDASGPGGTVEHGVNVPTTGPLQVDLTVSEELWAVVPASAGGPFSYSFLTTDGVIV